MITLNGDKDKIAAIYTIDEIGDIRDNLRPVIIPENKRYAIINTEYLIGYIVYVDGNYNPVKDKFYNIDTDREEPYTKYVLTRYQGAFHLRKLSPGGFLILIHMRTEDETIEFSNKVSLNSKYCNKIPNEDRYEWRFDQYKNQLLPDIIREYKFDLIMKTSYNVVNIYAECKDYGINLLLVYTNNNRLITVEPDELCEEFLLSPSSEKYLDDNKNIKIKEVLIDLYRKEGI